jgi:hypothetical protein
MSASEETLRDGSSSCQHVAHKVRAAPVQNSRYGYELTSEEAADIAESDAADARGDFATDKQVQAIWAKHGL